MTFGGMLPDAQQLFDGAVEFVDASNPITTAGLAAKLLVDTTGFTVGTFDLKLAGTEFGVDSELMGAPADFFNGTIQIALPGDANLDGIFDSSDMVLVFQSGHYEDNVPGNSDWTTGDWDGDGDFTSLDMVLAFQQGTYETAAAPGSVMGAVRGEIAVALFGRPGLPGAGTLGAGAESLPGEHIPQWSTAAFPARPTLGTVILGRSMFEWTRQDSALRRGAKPAAEAADRVWQDLREEGVLDWFAEL